MLPDGVNRRIKEVRGSVWGGDDPHTPGSAPKMTPTPGDECIPGLFIPNSPWAEEAADVKSGPTASEHTIFRTTIKAFTLDGDRRRPPTSPTWQFSVSARAPHSTGEAFPVALNAICEALTPYSFPPTPPAVKVRSRHDAYLLRDRIRLVTVIHDHAPELHLVTKVEELTIAELLLGID
ncbi:hypothetical protein ACFXPI_05830 [Streptomyces sp. NPDC059104]|uniref:hypothetical protein n=1 Tax=Streptomyces sp. NPDC059104 TaxID=3346729 RepID=UPI00369ABB88